MASIITWLLPSVAFAEVLPVLVLMKSPGRSTRIARNDAARMLSYVSSSLVSKITFSVASPHASSTCAISSCTSASSPARNAPRLITMSISSAPSPTAARTSARRVFSGACPDGNAVATEATLTVEPATPRFACRTIAGYTHTAAVLGTSMPSCGVIALRQSDAIFPGVSFPSSVVRSIIETASFSPKSFDFFLMLRVTYFATRSSTPTASTEPTSSISRRRAPGETTGIVRCYACGSCGQFKNATMSQNPAMGGEDVTQGRKGAKAQRDVHRITLIRWEEGCLLASASSLRLCVTSHRQF